MWDIAPMGQESNGEMRHRLMQVLSSDERDDAVSDGNAIRRFYGRAGSLASHAKPSSHAKDGRVIHLAQWARTRIFVPASE
jgi:hypothetical protein